MNIEMLLKELPSAFRKVASVMQPFATSRVTRREQDHWLIRGGGDAPIRILLVCHIDTVLPPQWRGVHKGKIYATGLDDRLGFAIGCLALKAYPNVDLLVCDDEEIGRSSAGNVLPSELAMYGAIIELDRGGNDYVDYGLSGADMQAAMPQGIKKGHGAFSDICSLVTPPCGCVNLGVGYQLAHSVESYAKVRDVAKSLAYLDTILTSFAGRKFEPCKDDFGGWEDWAYRPLSSLPKGITKGITKYDTWDDEPDPLSTRLYECDECQETFLERDLEEYGGDWLCADCLEFFTAELEDYA